MDPRALTTTPFRSLVAAFGLALLGAGLWGQNCISMLPKLSGDDYGFAGCRAKEDGGNGWEMGLLTAPQEPQDLLSPLNEAPHLGQDELCILADGVGLW
ncbi:Uu.00g072050.m01.CDS01 [Anthostomella pinea]|uniref:Uu.00g072050.m01.CDS01 n=1 Tax=Anthostomella pinea TaxID=933095 RepID=A0AAI8VVW4_9PEZI|nr:Uu.00g072050.m01.CDS01 [Anthostomella pinea]